MSTELVDAGTLAERWGVSRATALSYTRQRGFPSPVGLSPKTLRWDKTDIAQWEQTRKATPVRRVTRRRTVRKPDTIRPIVRKVGASR